MVAFFVMGTAATKLGYRVKAARGIAQEKGGARGWRNAWANGGVPGAPGPAGRLHRGGRPGAPDPGLRGGGGHRGGGHLLLGGGQGLRPAHVPHHHAPAGAAGHRRRGQPGGDARRPGRGAVVVAWWAARSASTVPWVLVAVAAAGLLGSLAESVVGTVAERRGWMGNDLLNAFNTAVGWLVTAGGAPVAPARHEQGCRAYVELARPFTLLPPALGVLSGAVTAWGAGHQKAPLTADLAVARPLRHAHGGGAQRGQQRASTRSTTSASTA